MCSECIYFSANSVTKWEALLQDISNIECFSAVSQSLAHKLFSHRERGDSVDLQIKVSLQFCFCLNVSATISLVQDKEVLDSLLRGYEAELENAAKGDISLKILNLFSEVKRIQNEQPIDEEQNNQVVWTDDLLE